MAIKYVVLNNGILVIERWAGHISHHELIEHVRNRLNDVSITRGASLLADAREAYFPETTLEGLDELADLQTNPDNKTSINRCALLVRYETWPLAKALETREEMRGVMTLITFSMLDMACIWLGIDIDTAMSYLKKIADNQCSFCG